MCYFNTVCEWQCYKIDNHRGNPLSMRFIEWRRSRKRSMHVHWIHSRKQSPQLFHYHTAVHAGFMFLYQQSPIRYLRVIWERPQPIREDDTYVTFSLVGCDLDWRILPINNRPMWNMPYRILSCHIKRCCLYRQAVNKLIKIRNPIT